MRLTRVLCVLLVTAAFFSARAATIDVTGPDGAPGVDGTAGGSGGAGGPGGDATASATDAGSSNTANATGGTGGVGGAGSIPGVGGVGGIGGAASAMVSVLDSSGTNTTEADAEAIGGTGGEGGVPGGAGGAGGHADASAYGQSAGGVLGVSANAQGGAGGNGATGGNGGTASLGPVVGSMTSFGYVTVSAHTGGGNGGADVSSLDPASGHHGDGASASLVNAVSGSSSGYLFFFQDVNGGSASLDAAANPHAGAGVGGSASNSLTLDLTSQSLVSTQVSTNATAGNGSIGEASPGRTVGNGGNATDYTDLTTSAGTTYLSAYSNGGQGVGLGNGGDATQESHLHIVGDGRSGSVSSFTNGGSGGAAPLFGDIGFCTHGGDFCRGGNAISVSTGDTLGASLISVADSATGGSGGSADPTSTIRQDGARGGDATSSVSVTSGYRGIANSSAIGGAGGDGAGPGSLGGAGGSASAHASVSAVLYASASVSVTGGRGGGGAAGAARGGDVDLENVPVAAAQDSVSLAQDATGGDSGSGPGSRGGDARSVLTPSSVSSSTLSLGVSAAGGSASSPDGSARAGDASVVADASGSGSQAVFVGASAFAGGIREGSGTLGTATLERVHGSSDSGAVDVQGSAYGGRGAIGGSIDLDDVVQGETTGSLSLTQRAVGGDSWSVGGNASSRLHRSGAMTSLALETDAQGGAADDPLATVQGGNAFAESEGSAAGSTKIQAFASGGSLSRGSGGNAEAHATGHDLGTTSGGALSVANASGGSGGDFGGTSGHGGDGLATSLAASQNPTASVVESRAFAFGGDVASSSTGSGGTASAESTALSTASHVGQILSTATATAGSTYTQSGYDTVTLSRSHAEATATAQGNANLLDAEAWTLGAAESPAVSHVLTQRDALVGVHAEIAGSSGTPSWAHASTRAGGQESLADARNRLGSGTASAYLSGVENPATSWAVGNGNVLNSLSQGGTIVAQGLFASDYSRDWSGATTLELDRSHLNGSSPFRIGFLDPEIPTLGLDLLEVHIAVDGHAVADVSFDSAAAALTALDDKLVTVDPSDVGTGALVTVVVSYALHATAVTGSEVFLSNFVVIAPVPEPAACLLLAVAAMGLLLRQSCVRSRAAR